MAWIRGQQKAVDLVTRGLWEAEELADEPQGKIAGVVGDDVRTIVPRHLGEDVDGVRAQRSTEGLDAAGIEGTRQAAAQPVVDRSIVRRHGAGAPRMERAVADAESLQRGDTELAQAGSVWTVSKSAASSSMVSPFTVRAVRPRRRASRPGRLRILPELRICEVNGQWGSQRPLPPRRRTAAAVPATCPTLMLPRRPCPGARRTMWSPLPPTQYGHAPEVPTDGNHRRAVRAGGSRRGRVWWRQGDRTRGGRVVRPRRGENRDRRSRPSGAGGGVRPHRRHRAGHARRHHRRVGEGAGGFLGGAGRRGPRPHRHLGQCGRDPAVRSHRRDDRGGPRSDHRHQPEGRVLGQCGRGPR